MNFDLPESGQIFRLAGGSDKAEKSKNWSLKNIEIRGLTKEFSATLAVLKIRS